MIYTWIIEDLIKKSSVDGLSEVVTHVPFACVGKDETTGKEYNYHHMVKLPPPSSNSFVDFNSLTEEEVVGWVKANVDTQLIYSVISERIAMEAGDGLTIPWGTGGHEDNTGN
jgi:hypothetical protein